MEQGKGKGRLVCIDPTKRGEISAELAVDADGKLLPRRRTQAGNAQAGEMAIPYPNSGMIWSFESAGKGFENGMHRTINSVAVAKGLVIATDHSGILHCLDASSGRRQWFYDTLSTIWTSPLIVDQKAYVADENGEIAIFAL